MSGYGFFGVIRIFAFVGLIVLAGIFFCVSFAVGEISKEMSFRHRYGTEWQTKYDTEVGALSKAHERLGAAAFGIVALPTVSIWLCKLLQAKQYNTRSGGRPRKKQMSNTERTMQARSRALLGNYLGLLGIAVGLLLVIFRWHIFADHANESVLGMFIFATGYLGIMSGCWWWLRAKQWSEALIVIGLWPLPIMFIPFVRILFLRILLGTSPILLLLLLLLTPAILLVVVATLPDKSGVNKKRRVMNWRDIKQRPEKLNR